MNADFFDKFEFVWQALWAWIYKVLDYFYGEKEDTNEDEAPAA